MNERLTAGSAAHRRSARKDAREGRKLIASWHRVVSEKVVAGALLDVDERIARALTNFPSSVMKGFCWAGLAHLTAVLNKSERTIRRSNARLEANGLLHVRQRGKGRTNLYTFCIGNVRLFPADGRTSVTDPELTAVSGHTAFDRTGVSAKSCEDLESNKEEFLPNPSSLSGLVVPRDGRTEESSDESVSLNGEILGPEEDVTFDDFWRSLRGRPGPAGPASAQWRKLSAADKCAIGKAMGPGGLDLDGMWACTWLEDRRWKRPSLSLQISEDVTFSWPRRVVSLEPYTPEWMAERARMISAGEPISLMDAWAEKGKAWSAFLNSGEADEDNG